MNDGKSKKIKFDESSFSDVSKFESIVLDEKLIKIAKDVLKVKEIYL